MDKDSKSPVLDAIESELAHKFNTNHIWRACVLWTLCVFCPAFAFLVVPYYVWLFCKGLPKAVRWLVGDIREFNRKNREQNPTRAYFSAADKTVLKYFGGWMLFLFLVGLLDQVS